MNLEEKETLNGGLRGANHRAAQLGEIGSPAAMTLGWLVNGKRHHTGRQGKLVLCGHCQDDSI